MNYKDAKQFVEDVEKKAQEQLSLNFQIFQNQISPIEHRCLVQTEPIRLKHNNLRAQTNENWRKEISDMWNRMMKQIWDEYYGVDCRDQIPKEVENKYNERIAEYRSMSEPIHKKYREQLNELEKQCYEEAKQFEKEREDSIKPFETEYIQKGKDIRLKYFGNSNGCYK